MAPKELTYAEKLEILKKSFVATAGGTLYEKYGGKRLKKGKS